MMELMKGVVRYIQMSLLGLATLFFAIAYGAGTFWALESRNVKITFTLWKLCSSYGDNEICHSISSDNYLEEVILTSRACGGISMLLMVAMVVFVILWLIDERRGEMNDKWLHARTLLLSLLVLFLLILLTHSLNCPPKYKFGATLMPNVVSWGWSLSMTSFIFVLPVCFIHCFEEFQLYRSNSTKR